MRHGTQNILMLSTVYCACFAHTCRRQPQCSTTNATCQGVTRALGDLHSLMYIPSENAVLCAVPKAGCTTVRHIAYFLQEGNQSSNQSIHAWWFGHKMNMQNMNINKRRQIMTNRSIRKVAVIRQPEDRFMSGVFDKGHKVLGRNIYQKIGCAGANTWKNNTLSELCWSAGFKNVSNLQAAVFAKLPSANDHFKSQTEQCKFHSVAYNHIADIYDIGAFIDYIVSSASPNFEHTRSWLKAKYTSNHDLMHSSSAVHTKETTMQQEHCHKFYDIYHADTDVYECLVKGAGPSASTCVWAP